MEGREKMEVETVLFDDSSLFLFYYFSIVPNYTSCMCHKEACHSAL